MKKLVLILAVLILSSTSYIFANNYYPAQDSPDSDKELVPLMESQKVSVDCDCPVPSNNLLPQDNILIDINLFETDCGYKGTACGDGSECCTGICCHGTCK